MNIVTQTHLTLFGNEARKVLDGLHRGIDLWLSPTRILSSPSVSIIMTDDPGFASHAAETNDLVILISSESLHGHPSVVVVDIGADIADSVHVALLKVAN